MITIPAIDLRGGKVVRLVHGDPGAATIYGNDPVQVAEDFEERGAKMIHVVDLDAALGDGDNKRIVRDICRSVRVPVETGGGLRSIEAMASVLSTGAARVVLGTSAALDSDLLAEAIEKFGDRIIVALDVRGREVMTHGWKESAGPFDELLPRLAAMNTPRFMLTQIDVDGTLAGPEVKLYRDARRLTGAPMIASGGVRDAADLLALAETGVEGVIVGKAVYEGTIDIAEVAEL